MSRGIMQRLVGLCAVTAALACAKDTTSIYVTLKAESGVRAVAQGGFIRVFDADDQSATPMPIVTPQTFEFKDGDLTFLVNHTQSGHPRVRIEAEVYRLPAVMPGGGGGAGRFDGLMPGNGLANDRVIVEWQTDTILKVEMTLRDRCLISLIGRPCPLAQRCDSMGMCVDATVSPSPYR